MKTCICSLIVALVLVFSAGCGRGTQGCLEHCESDDECWLGYACLDTRARGFVCLPTACRRCFERDETCYHTEDEDDYGNLSCEFDYCS